MSWADPAHEGCTARGGLVINCSSYSLLDVNKDYEISSSRRCFVACHGASHGWLVMVNELSNLVLYNPFTTAAIDLPPITDFSCVQAVYGDKGSLEHYIFTETAVQETSYLGI
ncbi:hypothetical protein PR202_ga19373 [Eleusine coracana subsp. coracana]|uniref:KIB1-4 beta-propeller domain-containing protein n=1 Tax=Eleusine coracana subsp. coracana TaxID=191504 RepID=A0AAV5CUD9_ELECO|nr:hypothetical protein PR202_ga19373 [Eleusine coracana subsp. coracana]